MAKRRFRTEPESEEPPAATAEDRRKERKRRRGTTKSGRARSGNPWRTAAFIGIPVAIVVAVVVILLLNAAKPPCLNLGPVPASSGLPAYPPQNTTDFTGTWCPSGVTAVYAAFPLLQIRINGNYVGMPTDIGTKSNYSQGGQAYTCRLPLSTAPPVGAAPLAPGTIYIYSDWEYEYNLSAFFEVWSLTHSTVAVNASQPSQPVVYTPSDLLGYRADATHAIALYVDNSVVSAGPSLNLATLSNGGPVYPTCLASIYGTGHTILLTYSSTAVATVPAAPVGAAQATAAAPMLAPGPSAPLVPAGALVGPGSGGPPSLLWLAMRGAP